MQNKILKLKNNYQLHNQLMKNNWTLNSINKILVPTLNFLKTVPIVILIKKLI